MSYTKEGNATLAGNESITVHMHKESDNSTSVCISQLYLKYHIQSCTTC